MSMWLELVIWIVAFYLGFALLPYGSTFKEDIGKYYIVIPIIQIVCCYVFGIATMCFSVYKMVMIVINLI